MIFKKKSLLAIAAMFLASMVFMIACSDPPPVDPNPNPNPNPQPGNEINALQGEWVWDADDANTNNTGRWSSGAWGQSEPELGTLYAEDGKVNISNMWVPMNYPAGTPRGGAQVILNLRDGAEKFVNITSASKFTITYKSDYRLFLILEPVNPPEGNLGWTRWHAMLPSGTHTATFELGKMGGNWPTNAYQMTEPDLSGNHFRLHSWGAAQENIDLVNNLEAIYFAVPTDDDTEAGVSTSLEITQFKIH